MPYKYRRPHFTVLTSDIRCNDKISASAKLLWAEVSALIADDGIGVVPNEVLLTIFKVDERTISRWFAELVDQKLIHTAIDKSPKGSIRIVSFNKIDLAACRDSLTADFFDPADTSNTLIGFGPTLSVRGSPTTPSGVKTDAKPGVKPDACDYNAVLAEYHRICTSFPKIRTLNDARKSSIRARMKESGGRAAVFTELFTKAQASMFLRGEVGGKWRADFDFLFSQGGFAKTLEGKYDDRKEGPRKPGTDETPDFM